MQRHGLIFLAVLVTVGVIPVPVASVDHGRYDAILNKYVQGGYFDYDSFVENKTDREKLVQYLDSLSKVNPEQLSRDALLAYWINLYNASTIHLIEKNYPVESIKDLGGWMTGPFEKKFIETSRGKLSLDTIEHEIIRPNYDEPRIHFALVCAARSCPPLRNEAYVGHRLNSQLEDQTKQFLSSRKNRFILVNGILSLKLSSIFYWYSEDFDGESGVARYIADYLSDRKASKIENDNYSIEYRDYNWRLNQAPGPYKTK